jgi:hypothetical protein
MRAGPETVNVADAAAPPGRPENHRQRSTNRNLINRHPASGVMRSYEYRAGAASAHLDQARH